jgi:hypothetical protein
MQRFSGIFSQLLQLFPRYADKIFGSSAEFAGKN